MAALSTITELFYRQRTLPFPHVIVSGIRNILTQRQLNASSELYQDKLTELMRLFMAQQWNKWIDDEVVFPDIVSSLHTFTFESEFTTHTILSICQNPLFNQMRFFAQNTRNA